MPTLAVRIGRLNGHRASFDPSRAKEGPGTRAEFADGPTRIDPLEQGTSKQTLKIRARIDGALLEYSAVRAAYHIPARLAAGLERIKERTSGSHYNKVER